MLGLARAGGAKTKPQAPNDIYLVGVIKLVKSILFIFMLMLRQKGKLNIKLATLLRLEIRAACRFNSVQCPRGNSPFSGQIGVSRTDKCLPA